MRARYALVCLIAFMTPTQARAQIGGSGSPVANALEFQSTLPLRMALLTPAMGPDAALANPARLADAGVWHSQFAAGSGGRVGYQATGGGVGIRNRFYIGLQGMAQTGSHPGTNSVFLQHRLMIPIALRFGSAEGRQVALGYAPVVHAYNAFSIIKVGSIGHDLGFVWRGPTPGGTRLDISLAARNLLPNWYDMPVADSGYRNGPEGRKYRLFPATFDAQLHLASHSDFLSGWIGVSAVPAPGRQLARDETAPDRFGLLRAGLLVRPIPILAVRAEAFPHGVYAFGATIGSGAFLRWRLELDLAAAYGRYYEYVPPDHRGASLIGALRAGW